MGSSPVLTVTLNPALDKFVKLPQLSLERMDDFYLARLSAGGKGVNVSRALKNLGCPTLATGLLGGAAGLQVRKILQCEKIPFDFISIAGETRTNVTAVDGRGRSRRLLETGPHISAGEARLFLKRFSSLAAKSSWVVFSGQMAPGLSAGFFLKLLRIAKRAGRKVIVDASGVGLRMALRGAPYLLKPNLEEAEFLAGQRLKTISGLQKALAALCRKTRGRVIISLGAKGAVASDGKDFWQATTPVLREHNAAVGCGDALVAGFLWAQMLGQDFSQALRLAVASGCANLKAACPGDIHKAEVLRLAKRIHLKKLNF